MSRLACLLVVLLTMFSVSAKTLTLENTPEPLKPWVGWVLEDEKDYQCPFLFDNFKQKHCSWPGRLAIQLNARQAEFTSQWQVFQQSWIMLPGDSKYWPQNVRLNGQAATVTKKHGKPAMNLGPGNYRIQGLFFWHKLPESLSIPHNTGLLDLTINNQAIAQPIIKGDRLWLQESHTGQKASKKVENKLELQVFRKIDDLIPMQLMTFLELEVSGEARELVLPHALLSGFIPVSLNSPLPARIKNNGDLLLQLRPGRWHIQLNARYPEAMDEIKLLITDPKWPKSEIWSFNRQNFLRVVEVQNLVAIDPSQSNVPRQWRNLPAYLFKPGQSLKFKIIRRGDPEPEPNQLKLSRQLWLDFDGKAYTVSDHISGKMSRQWRLNAQDETLLGQIKINGRNQLITRDRDSAKVGVEVRDGKLDLVADSRIITDISNINAVGWDQDFHQPKAELNIPPGWRLISVSGADNNPNSWISRWTLLDLFLVLIAALAIARLWNIYWGIFALISLSLSWHEYQAPQFIWLNILAAIALIRVLPEGRFLNAIKWYRNLSWLSLLLIIIPFMVTQIRIGLYPQLEKPWQHISPNQQASYQAAPYAMEAEALSDMSSMKKQAVKLRPTVAAPMKSYKADKLYQRIDPNANIQTGPGLPQWQWHKVRLSWNGMVERQQTVSLFYLSPRVSMLLNFIIVFAVLVLSLLMFGVLDKPLKMPKSLFSLLLLLSLSLFPDQQAYADFPQQELLDDLKKRLLKAPECLPVCAEISNMHMQIDAEQLTIKLQIHAQQAVAIPLPAKPEQWMPRQVMQNGRVAEALIRHKKGLWLAVDAGVQQVELSGTTPLQNKFSIPLTLKPHRMTADSKNWHIQGLHANGQTDKQLILNRHQSILQQSSRQAKFNAAELPAFIRVERTLHLDLDWRITTRVIRVFDNAAPVALKIPLLANESVTSAGIRVADGQVKVNLSPGQKSLQWQSILKKSEQIKLLAADTDAWTEIWRANISPIWNLTSSGLSVVYHQKQGRWMPEWRPWPGEQLQLNITRPSAIDGSTLTIERTNLELKPGNRSLQAKLELFMRSSKGTQHTISLPDQAQLQSVKIDNLNQPIRQKQNQVTLPVKPGSQNIVLDWISSQQQSVIFTSPSIDIARKSVNHHLNITLGRDRWVLLTAGPSFGPAVLFWGILIMIAIVAIGLAKIHLTPLKYWQWFLLLVGLSQIALPLALCVVLWLFALGYRGLHQAATVNHFNLIQVGLGVLTLAAVFILFIAVQQGLLGSPDMQIAGNRSTAFNFNWYQDHNAEILPVASVVSVPLMSYRLLMLLWSLWLAVSLLNWLKWGWQCFTEQGYWKQSEDKVKKELEDKKA